MGNNFYSVPNKNGGRTWFSTDPIDQDDFAGLVNSKNSGGPITILSGTHGDEFGGLYPENLFFQEDTARWKANPDVTVIDITKLDAKAISEAVNRPGRVICAWCYSERSVGALSGMR